jgi:hypothetical protein
MFFTRVIPKRNEYRIHVFNGRAVRSGTKRPAEGLDPIANEGPLGIWNLDNGWAIRYEHPAPKAAKDIAKAAVKALGLDFAAVDIIEGLDGQFYFLEANTRPGLHGRTLAKYASKIKEVAERD